MTTKNSTYLLGESATYQNVANYATFLGMLPDPDMVLRKQGRDLRVYEELTFDSHLFSVMGSRRAGVRSLEWAIDRGNSKTHQSKIIEDLFNTTLKPYELMGSILEAPFYGYSIMEVVWEYRDNLILPKKVVSKPKEWFSFSPTGELLLKTIANPIGEPVPKNKFLMARNSPTYKNPYGEKILSRCFWPVVFKKGGIKFWVTFVEKYGMPFMVGKTPRGTSQEESDKLADSLELMIQDAIAVIPDDSSIEIKDATGKASSVDIYEKMINFFNAEISKAVLGQTLTTEVGNTGSYAASKTHQEVRGDLIVEDSHLVENTINTLVGWIWELNFSGTPPRFTLYEKEDVDRDLAERDKTLSETGVKFTKAYYIKAYGFDEGDIDIVDTPIPSPTQSVQNFSEAPILKDSIGLQSSQSTKEVEKEILKNVMEIMQEASTYEEAIDAILGAYPTFELPALQNTIDRFTTNSMILGGAELVIDRL